MFLYDTIIFSIPPSQASLLKKIPPVSSLYVLVGGGSLGRGGGVF